MEQVKFCKNGLFVRNYDRWYKVTAMFTDQNRANEYMATVKVVNDGFHGDWEGVIKVIGDDIFLSKMSDTGIKELVDSPPLFHGFSDEEIKYIGTVIEKVWNYIYGDVLVDDEGNFDSSVTLTQYDVAELCLDADRWKDHVDEGQWKVFRNILDKLVELGFGSRECKAVIARALPCAVYGY